jgi:hypothetical protein
MSPAVPHDQQSIEQAKRDCRHDEHIHRTAFPANAPPECRSSREIWRSPLSEPSGHRRTTEWDDTSEPWLKPTRRLGGRRRQDPCLFEHQREVRDRLFVDGSTARPLSTAGFSAGCGRLGSSGSGVPSRHLSAPRSGRQIVP